LIGGVVLIGVAGFIVVALVARATYVWGFGVVFVVGVAVLLALAWFYDRRNARRRAQLTGSDVPLTPREDDEVPGLGLGDRPLPLEDDDERPHRVGV
jgi:hypothetical protein